MSFEKSENSFGKRFVAGKRVFPSEKCVRSVKLSTRQRDGDEMEVIVRTYWIL